MLLLELLMQRFVRIVCPIQIDLMSIVAYVIGHGHRLKMIQVIIVIILHVGRTGVDVERRKITHRHTNIFTHIDAELVTVRGRCGVGCIDGQVHVVWEDTVLRQREFFRFAESSTPPLPKLSSQVPAIWKYKKNQRVRKGDLGLNMNEFGHTLIIVFLRYRMHHL